MLKKIIFHCGFHKTGSSSIQQFFQNEKDSGNVEDVFYPVFLNECNQSVSFNHSETIFSCFTRNPANYHINRRLKLSSGDLKKMNSEYIVQFKSQLEECNKSNIVISGEDISMLGPAELARLIEFVRSVPGCAEIEIAAVVYVRNPNNQFASEVQQSIKGGITIQKALEKRISALTTKVITKLKNLKSVFGEGLKVYKFEDAIKHPGGLVRHFLDSLDIPCSIENSTFRAYRANKSYSYEALELFSAVNQELPVFLDSSLNPLREGDDFLVFRSIRGSKFVIEREHQALCWEKSANVVSTLFSEYGISYNFKFLDPEGELWADETINDLCKVYPKLGKAVRRVIIQYLKRRVLALSKDNIELCRRYFMALKRLEPGSNFVTKSESNVNGSFIIISPYTIAGWVWCRETPNLRVAFSIFINDKKVYSGVADQKRQDLADADIGDGCYAFKLSLISYLNPGKNEIRVECDCGYELLGSPSWVTVHKRPVFPKFEPYSNKGLALRHTRYGYMFLNTFDRGVDQAILEYGEWASDEVDLFEELLSHGDTALDVGGNIGASCLPMADFVGEDGTVHTFEPQQYNYYRLCSHILLNSRNNIIPHLNAVGSGAEASVEIPIVDYSVEHSSGSVSVSSESQSKASIPVAAISIDNFCADYELSPSLIKIDVVGFELNVINGALNCLKQFTPSVYFESHTESHHTKMVGLLKMCMPDYKLYWHVARIFRDDNFNGSNKDIYSGGGVSFNVLATTKEISVNQPGFKPILKDSDFWPKEQFPKIFHGKIDIFKRNVN